MIDLTGARWRKASASTGSNGGCVEVASLAGRAAIRDSKRPADGAHVVAPAAFTAFLVDAKAGRYDLGRIAATAELA